MGKARPRWNDQVRTARTIVPGRRFKRVGSMGILQTKFEEVIEVISGVRKSNNFPHRPFFLVRKPYSQFPDLATRVFLGDCSIIPYESGLWNSMNYLKRLRKNSRSNIPNQENT